MTTLKLVKGRQTLPVQINALEAAFSIARDRAETCRRMEVEWKEKYPDDGLGAATERAARQEAELIAKRIGMLLKTARSQGQGA